MLRAHPADAAAPRIMASVTVAVVLVAGAAAVAVVAVPGR
jgi:hypothetical protein